MRNIVILMPAYEEFVSAKKLVTDLSRLSDFKIFVLIVDDGSLYHPITDRVFEGTEVEGLVLSLARNVGHQAAIAAGLTFLHDSAHTFDAVVVMDSDGEDDPAFIPDLISALYSGAHDVVVACRGKRSEGIYFRLFYFVYRYIFLIFTGKTINFGNYMILRRDVLSRVIQYNSLWTHFAATVIAARLRLNFLRVNRKKRYFGESKMNFFSLCLHGFRALMVFADDVLVRVGMASSLIALVAMLLSIIAAFLKLVGIATPGWFSIAIGILALVFLQTGALTLISLMLSSKTKREYVMQKGTGSLIARVFSSRNE